jgi:hypothetical protein
MLITDLGPWTPFQYSKMYLVWVSTVMHNPQRYGNFMDLKEFEKEGHRAYKGGILVDIVHLQSKAKYIWCIPLIWVENHMEIKDAFDANLGNSGVQKKSHGESISDCYNLRKLFKV